MSRTISLLMFLSFLSCQIGSNKPEADQVNSERYDLLLRNGNIIDLETGNVTIGTIAIRDGRIVEIIRGDQNQAVNSDSIIDVSNKFVLPGFWDNHVHFRGGDSLIDDNKDFLTLFIKNGITTVRDAGGDLGKSVIKWRDAINGEQMLGPTIFTAGPKIDGPNARWEGSLEVEDSNNVRKALDSLQQLKVDFVKLYDSTISSDAYINSIAEAEKRGMITSGHMPFTVTLKEALDAGLDGIEHMYYVLKGCSSNEIAITESVRKGELGFWDSMSGLISTYSDSTANRTFNHLKQNNAFVVPTLHIGDVLSYIDEVDHTQDEYLQYMSDEMRKTYEGRINSALRASDEARSDRKALNTFFKELTDKLNQADVNILAGSDCGAYNSYVYPGVSLHKELEALVEAGLTPLEALRTSAFNGAKFLNQDDDYGSIEKGKMADIVVLNDNPLNTIKASKDIVYVIKNGKLFE